MNIFLKCRVRIHSAPRNLFRGSLARSRSPPFRRRKRSPQRRLRDWRCIARTPCASGSECAHIRNLCGRQGWTARRSTSRRSASSPRWSWDRSPGRHARQRVAKPSVLRSVIPSSRLRDAEIVDEVEASGDTKEAVAVHDDGDQIAAEQRN
jgi:hypothetical protein